jgi:hypothetical protein
MSRHTLIRYGRAFAASMRKVERNWPVTMVLILLAIILLAALKPA